KPVGKVGVGLEDLPLPIEPSMGANSTRFGNSGPDGSFEVDVPLPAGMFPVTVQGREYRLVRPRTATGGEATGLEDLRVIVQALASNSISGTVVDEEGYGIGGVRLALLPSSPPAPGQSPELAEVSAAAMRTFPLGRSEDDGMFSVRAPSSWSTDGSTVL